jgi:hypothetical protein
MSASPPAYVQGRPPGERTLGVLGPVPRYEDALEHRCLPSVSVDCSASGREAGSCVESGRAARRATPATAAPAAASKRKWFPVATITSNKKSG